MGYNTTVVVMNDALHDIENDPNFGKNLSAAISRMSLPDVRFVDVPAGYHCNAATVIETHHADGMALIAVGQNFGEHLGLFYPYGEGDLNVRLLKALADELGYRVSKKPGSK